MKWQSFVTMALLQSIMPIVMTKDEYARIMKWTDKDKEDPETVRRREYIKYLDEQSREMTKTWPNSVENVNKRNEELRRARVEAAEQVNATFYRRYVRRRKHEQQRMLYNARDIIFKNKDAPKMLLSAVVESTILKEREEQVKFNEKLRQMALDDKRQEDEAIQQRAKDWHAAKRDKQRKRFEVNKKHQNEIVEQAREYADRQRQEHEEELRMQQLDNVNAQREMDAIKEFDDQYKASEKARIWSDMKRAAEEQAARLKEQETLQNMEQQLQDLLTASTARVQSRRILTEQTLREEKRKILEQISQKLESGDAAREAREQASLEKAVKEKDAIVEARHTAQLAKQEQFKQQRIKDREKFLSDQARQERQDHARRCWELVNRFKNQEIYEDYKEHQWLEKERKVKAYREEILRLAKERRDREEKELADTRSFYGDQALAKLREADSRLLAHADQLLEEAKAHGRPDHPLKKAIDRYCSMNRLYALPPLPAALQAHFPSYSAADLSRPRAGYAPPTAPPKYVDEDSVLDLTRKDGLQEVKPPPAAPTVPAAPEAGDYRRAGRADGLQRRESASAALPAVAAVPCKTHDCSCEMKK